MFHAGLLLYLYLLIDFVPTSFKKNPYFVLNFINRLFTFETKFIKLKNISHSSKFIGPCKSLLESDRFLAIMSSSEAAAKLPCKTGALKMYFQK